MREIQLTNGGAARVSDEDYEFLSRWNWQTSDGRYASRHLKLGVRDISIKMHNEVLKRMGIVTPPGYECDHKNRDGLDNQRDNLRVATKSANVHNRNLFRNNTSGVAGVSWYERYGKWQARLGVRGRRLLLGYFFTFEDAVNARLAAEVRYIGGEYTTNLPGPVTDLTIK